MPSLRSRGAWALLLPLCAASAAGCSSDDDGATPSTATSGDGAGGNAASTAAGANGAGGAGGDGGMVPPPPPNVLLFSKTAGFRHDSIEDAVSALTALGQQRGWKVQATEDAAVFTNAALADFDVVVWLMTSGDVLDQSQQSAYQRFVAQGSGYVGVHSASDTEYDWPFYGELVGAWFANHPAIQQATLRVERTAHPATSSLPAPTWSRTDEWYNFVINPRADVQVLLSLDEGSYDAGPGAMGDHPISWYHGHGGGRSFYTALGHTKESWAEPAFVEHVAGGITWAAGAEDPRVVVAELDGVADTGVWDAHDYAGGSFSYDVGPAALVMHDAGGGNQHLVRRGVLVDASRPYAIEALFRVHGSSSSSPENSFCLNLGVAGPDGDTAPPSTWAMNLDVSTDSPSGVMKHMGFVEGAFVEIGQTPVDWADFDTEYLLRVAVNADETGAFAADLVTTTVHEAGVLRQQFSVDYGEYPYQPSADQPVRIGANTHGTDWTMRGLRVYYLDRAAGR